VECGYYDAGTCRSCTWLPTPYADQVAAKDARARELLAPFAGLRWEPPVTGPQERFRNKAKMVVGGTVEQPRLGILDAAGRGTDLRGCALHEPVLHDALPVLAELVTRARLTPYDVPARRGELKHVVATSSPDGELMVRLVLRSTEALPRLRKQLPWLRAALPHLRVLSADLQPRHAAVLDGEQEEVLLGSTLPVRVGGFTLHLRPTGFFQTDTTVAAALYREAAGWAAQVPWRSAWDLYCGVGGFALHLAASGREVTGVEVTPEAVTAARESAAEAGVPARFEAGDATAWVAQRPDVPDLVVVNPPRRGTGEELAGLLERSAVRHLLYSSCNPVTLARDLAAMPSLRPVRARVFDMFPHTPHQEVLVLCTRR
jgi:23S rRNA (uracil747-C5)-methyltransferase